jgi:hypothetical protein
MVIKKRQARGEKNGRAVLTSFDIVTFVASRTAEACRPRQFFLILLAPIRDKT